MTIYHHYVERRPMQDSGRPPKDIATDRMRKNRMEQLTAEDGRQRRPWQVSFMLRFALHLAFYGWVVFWLLGQPEIPIRWLQ